jgi:hypothetical protein
MNYSKEIIKALVLGIGIFLVLQGVNLLVYQHPINIIVLKWNFIFTMLYSVVLYLVNAIVFIQLDKFFEKNRFDLKRLIIGFLASFFFSGVAIFFLRVLEDVGFEKKSFGKFLEDEKPENYVFAMVITVVVTLVVHLIYFYKNYQENRVNEQKIIAGTASAQFESLKNQLDPHFLFNSLNVLSALIEENPENAQKFTASLSKIYRYVLEQRDKELVTVHEELAFAKTYMELLKMRFENSLEFDLTAFDCPTEGKIIPLALQLLLENCIKHNVASEQKPLKIKIYCDGGELIVENNKQKKEVLQTRNGVGLQNILNRYAILTTRNVIIEELTDSFKVKLPILTKQVNNMKTYSQYNEEAAYERAKSRVNELKDFYGSLISYLIVIPILIFINLKTVSNFQWFWFPALGWGIGLLFHGFRVFGYGKTWEERKIKEILEKEEKANNNWQ